MKLSGNRITKDMAVNLPEDAPGEWGLHLLPAASPAEIHMAVSASRRLRAPLDRALHTVPAANTHHQGKPSAGPGRARAPRISGSQPGSRLLDDTPGTEGTEGQSPSQPSLSQHPSAGCCTGSWHNTARRQLPGTGHPSSRVCSSQGAPGWGGLVQEAQSKQTAPLGTPRPPMSGQGPRT